MADRCTGCSHARHEPGECFREIQTRAGKTPVTQDCPCIYVRPTRERTTP